MESSERRKPCDVDVGQRDNFDKISAFALLSQLITSYPTNHCFATVRKLRTAEK
jgi:hypothetical protein